MTTKLVRAVTLVALQDPIPEKSVSSLVPPRRFAAVFINLRNTDNVPRLLQLQRVEIIAVDSRISQLCQVEFQAIALKPGESRTLDVFLNQEPPYSTRSLLKAIVVYAVDGRTYVIGSMTVPIRSQ